VYFIQHTLEVDCKEWEKVQNSINSHYIEFESLKDPLCEDNTYRERMDIIFNRWTIVLKRLQNNLTQLEVKIMRNYCFYLKLFKFSLI
jgi:hypothetical protein